ncbi:MAG: STAS domain-containing protein [Chloroflexota bacterium]
MEITISQKQGRVPVTVFHISGVVDASTYQEFTDRLRTAIEKDGVEYLLLDLAEVPFISSAGIRSLNEISLLLDRKFPREKIGKVAHSSHLKLLHPQKSVSDILQMSGVEMFFETHTDLERAVASF